LAVLMLLLTVVRPAAAAWQQISDWTDCGSTNFETTRILVDFSDETYWLNMTVEGVFLSQVADANTQTNKASNSRPPIHG
jgi:hypothetical protein